MLSRWQTNMIQLHGALKAARASLNAVTVIAGADSDFSDPLTDIESRLASIDEELRKLARDVAKGCGL